MELRKLVSREALATRESPGKMPWRGDCIPIWTLTSQGTYIDVSVLDSPVNGPVSPGGKDSDLNVLHVIHRTLSQMFPAVSLGSVMRSHQLIRAGRHLQPAILRCLVITIVQRVLR